MPISSFFPVLFAYLSGYFCVVLVAGIFIDLLSSGAESFATVSQLWLWHLLQLCWPLSVFVCASVRVCELHSEAQRSFLALF